MRGSCPGTLALKLKRAMLGLVWAEPARCFGAAVVSGGHLWFGHWIFWAGPALACVVFCASTQIIPYDHLHAEGYRHDFKASQGLLED
ncbi:hypothetical protein ACH5RR_021948 [Cinchona calisaya]|uniref:Uncharacterized protein n=1 Tax=Cinchona calisaya TaxID=153742 RepID=A0ABD2Z6F4_9GENT